MNDRRIDPLTLGAIWRGLTATANQAGQVLQRTAYSEPIREAKDFSVGVFDAQGRMVAQGDYSPGHLGSMPDVIRHVLSVYDPEGLEAGDVIVFNDPWMGSGHLQDWMIAAPIKREGELIGYAVSCVHMIDVGGGTPGSQQIVGVRDNYQEGIRLLPIRLWQAGKVQPELLRVIEANVRLPEKLLGDLYAAQRCSHYAAGRVVALVDRFGRATFDEVCDSILDRSEDAMRDAIRDLPDGTYSAEDYLDDCGRSTEPIKLVASVTVDGSELTIDFNGSSKQTDSAINAVENYRMAYCYFAAQATLHGYRLPQNAGSLRPIHSIAPAGSVMNVQRPAGNAGRHIMQQRIVDVIMAALSGAAPEKIMAPSSNWANPIVGGIDPRDGKPFIYYEILVGGFGGRHGTDGVEAMASSLNVDSIPTEVNEHSCPILVERYELIRDSAGPGRWRGGHGVRKDVRFMGEQMHLANLAERQRFAVPGVLGGGAGRPGETVLNPGKVNERKVHSKEGTSLETGDVLSQRISGGGGFGNPHERESEAIRRDVEAGVTSPEAARLEYGWTAV